MRYRLANASLFLDGSYIPVHVTGDHADRVVAFARRHGNAWCMLVVPRITQPIAPPEQPPIAQVWGDTALEIPDGMPLSWRNVMTSEEPTSLHIADIFSAVPFALLVPLEQER
jgi:(1->4)-alpha-D-glucan 1-alpha-D-glucosylmutase